MSSVLGVVLLFGMIAIVSVGLVAVGLNLTDGTGNSIEYEQAEYSLTEFAESADRLAAGETSEGSYAVRGASEGEVRSIPEDGNVITINVTDREADEEIFSVERELGSVVYRAEDGTRFAYQAGGVWRVDPDGSTSLVRPPKFHYRDQPAPTLTFPVVLVREEFGETGEARGTMRTGQSIRHYPDEPNHYNPLTNGSVVVSVDSEFCAGWESFFRDRTDGDVTESCDAAGATEKGEVSIELSVPFEIDNLQNGIAFQNDVDDDNIVGDYASGGHTARSPTTLVDDKVETCAEEGEDLDGSTTIDDPGLYCADDGEMTESANYTVNTSDGDVEIAVDGDVYDQIKGSNPGINVEGTNNLTIFVNGDLFTGDGGDNVFGNDSDVAQTRFFVSSGNKVGDNSNVGEVYALIYAPTSTANFGGGFYFEGGLIAEDLQTQGGSGDIVLNEAVEDISYRHVPGDASLYYLHISETEVVLDPK